MLWEAIGSRKKSLCICPLSLHPDVPERSSPSRVRFAGKTRARTLDYCVPFRRFSPQKGAGRFISASRTKLGKSWNTQLLAAFGKRCLAVLNHHNARVGSEPPAPFLFHPLIFRCVAPLTSSGNGKIRPPRPGRGEPPISGEQNHPRLGITTEHHCVRVKNHTTDLALEMCAYAGPYS